MPPPQLTSAATSQPSAPRIAMERMRTRTPEQVGNFCAGLRLRNSATARVSGPAGASRRCDLSCALTTPGDAARDRPLGGHSDVCVCDLAFVRLAFARLSLLSASSCMRRAFS